MCGICAVIGPEAPGFPIKEMCRLIRHRGPDDEGYLVDDWFALGMRRLSIIDLEGGKQPIFNEDESVAIVFNGEIYNYKELRDELIRRGHEFRTNSDTETIVHAYEEYGMRFVEKLRGMFAFVLIDRERKVAVFARDRFGKKPVLYGFHGGNNLVVMSELKSLLPLFDYRFPLSKVSRLAVSYFLAYGYVPYPYTILRGFYKLPPGCVAVYSFKSNRMFISRYWDFVYTSDPSLTDTDWILERIRSVILESVKLRLRSDVDLGVLLSGGLDSTVVSAFMARVADNVKAFTIAFDYADFNELKYAEIVASKLGLEHYVLHLTAGSLLDLEKLVWLFDEPFSDSSMIPTYFVSKLARGYVKVALTGDGGDEMFIGYPWMTYTCRYGYISSLAYIGGIELPVVTRRTLVAYSKILSGLYSFLNAMLLFSPREIRSVTGVHVNPYVLIKRHLKEYLAKGGSLDSVDIANYLTIKFYLANDILVKVDRASMGTSLEVRCPLLDHNLLHVLSAVPASVRFHNGVHKYLLKALIKRYNLLPVFLTKLPKRGFGAPIKYWFREFDVDNLFYDAVRDVDGRLLDKTSLMEVYRRDSERAGRALYARRLFSLVNLLLWLKVFT